MLLLTISYSRNHDVGPADDKDTTPAGLVDLSTYPEFGDASRGNVWSPFPPIQAVLLAVGKYNIQNTSLLGARLWHPREKTESPIPGIPDPHYRCPAAYLHRESVLNHLRQQRAVVIRQAAFMIAIWVLYLGGVMRNLDWPPVEAQSIVPGLRDSALDHCGRSSATTLTRRGTV